MPPYFGPPWLRGVEFQVKAMRDAAKNEGGGAGVGMSIGAGVALGQQMVDMFNQPPSAVPTTPESPTASPQPSVAERLTTLEKLRKLGLISQEEYTAKRGAILDEI